MASIERTAYPRFKEKLTDSEYQDVFDLDLGSATHFPDGTIMNYAVTLLVNKIGEASVWRIYIYETS